jgi:GTP-binding protein
MITGKAVFPDGERLNAIHIGKYNAVDSLPMTPAEVAFIGRSNSGKSSLLRALLNCPNPPKVSSRPGSTRLIHLYELGTKQRPKPEVGTDAGIVGLSLADFPGYGYAQSAAYFRDRFSQMLTDYLATERPVKALCLLMDCRRMPQAEELQIARIARDRHVPTLLILNKADQLNQAETSKVTRSYVGVKDFVEIVLVSASKRQNLAYLRNYISSLG